MTEYKPDLGLRRRVAEVAGWTELEEISSTGGTKLVGVNQWGRRSICEYETSLDAIIPLVRDVIRMRHWLKLEHDKYLIRWNEETGEDIAYAYDFPEWLIYEATPTGYCRAFLAAKGESSDTQ